MIKKYGVILSLALGCLSLLSQLQATPLMTAASGNESASTTWVRVDTGSYLDSEAFVNAFLTSALAYTSTFTPVAGTYDGIAFKFKVRQLTVPGYITAIVAYSTSSQVTPTIVSSVSINVADIAYCNSSDTGWVLFKSSLTFSPNGSTGYVAALYTPFGSQIAPYRDTTVSNWSRALRSTTNQTPTTGDQLIMIGESTGPAVGNNFIVTWDSATAVVFGSTGSANLQQSITIGSRMTVNAGTSASTNYKMSAAGIIRVVNNGILNIGSAGSSFPASSTFVLTSSGIVNVDSGIDIGNDGNFNVFAATKTPFVYMSSDVLVGQSSITVAGDISNWVNGDTVTIATSDRTPGHTEISTITAISGQVITLSKTLSNFHSGTIPTQAEIENLTRNVVIMGLSSAIQGYVFMENTSSSNVQYVEFKNLGSATINKRGIDITSIAGGSTTINGCSVHDNAVAGSVGINQSGASGINYSISNNVFYNNPINFFDVPNLGPETVSGNIFGNTSGTSSTWANGKANYVNNNTFGSGVIGSVLNIANIIQGIISGNVFHSNTSAGLDVVNILDGLISNTSSYFNGGAGIDTEATRGHIVFNNAMTLGNTTTNIDNSTIISGANGLSGLIEFNNLTCNSSTTFSTAECMRFTANSSQYLFDNLISGNLSPHTRTIAGNGTSIFTRAIFRNPSIAEGNFVNAQSFMSTGSYIAVQRYNRTNGNHQDYKAEGLIQTDNTIVNFSSPSIRMTPIVSSTTIQLLSTDYPGRSWEIAVSSMQTGVATVWVRNSVAGDGTAYNGGPPQLWVHKNTAIGINADTLLATYSGTNGTWTQLQSTIPTPTDNGVEEFYVTNNGTTGWTNVDDFSVNFNTDTTGFVNWIDGASVANQNNSGTKTNILIGTTINSPSSFQ